MSDSSEAIAVIGLGSTLRRDDGVGIHVLSLLADRFKADGRLTFLDFGAASVDLVNRIQDFSRVLLIDAIDAGLAPAALRIFELKDVACDINEKKISSHELSLADLFRLYETLGLSTPVHVAGIQVKDVSYGLEMSRELEEAKLRVADEIGAFLRSLEA